jgi:hypothetical protein
MARTEIIEKFDAPLHPENARAHVETWRKQGLRDVASAQQHVDALKRRRPHAPEAADRALHELRAAATALVDAIDRI